MLGMINDFEEFITKANTRMRDLEKLKDELLIYNDPAFMASLERADEDIKAGRVTRCNTAGERRELFMSL